MEEKELLSLGIEIVSAMKAACYGVSIEEGRELALENTRGDSKMEVFERKMLHDQALFVANATLNYLSTRNHESRPSDGLLWEAYWEGNKKSRPFSATKQYIIDEFAEWLSTLPPDPLADDRQVVFDAWDNGYLGISGEYEIAQPILKSLKRIMGVEVANG